MTRIAASTTAWAARLKPQERPAAVLGHHPGLEPQPRSGVIDRVDHKLIGPAGVGQHEPGHRAAGRAGGGSARRPATTRARSSRIIAEMEDARLATAAGWRRSGWWERAAARAARAGPAARSDVFDGRPHRREVHLAGGVGGGDKAFDDHEVLFIIRRVID